MAHAATCSCGEVADHVIARRTTLDGRLVLIWSDGLVTFGLGFRVPGVGRARYAYRRRLDLRAAWIVAGEVELYEAAAVAGLVEAARRAVRMPGTPDDAVARRSMLAILAKSCGGAE